jgi:hypothetical protein
LSRRTNVFVAVLHQKAHALAHERLTARIRRRQRQHVAEAGNVGEQATVPEAAARQGVYDGRRGRVVVCDGLEDGEARER